MTTKELLIAARALIAEPNNWCQGFTAVRNGEHVSYCMAGAVSRVCADESTSKATETLDALSEAVNNTNGRFHSIVGFNDHKETTHEQILAIFDKAIAEAGQ